MLDFEKDSYEFLSNLRRGDSVESVINSYTEEKPLSRVDTIEDLIRNLDILSSQGKLCLQDYKWIPEIYSATSDHTPLSALTSKKIYLIAFRSLFGPTLSSSSRRHIIQVIDAIYKDSNLEKLSARDLSKALFFWREILEDRSTLHLPPAFVAELTPLLLIYMEELLPSFKSISEENRIKVLSALYQLVKGKTLARGAYAPIFAKAFINNISAIPSNCKELAETLKRFLPSSYNPLDFGSNPYYKNNGPYISELVATPSSTRLFCCRVMDFLQSCLVEVDPSMKAWFSTDITPRSYPATTLDLWTEDKPSLFYFISKIEKFGLSQVKELIRYYFIYVDTSSVETNNPMLVRSPLGLRLYLNYLTTLDKVNAEEVAEQFAMWYTQAFPLFQERQPREMLINISPTRLSTDICRRLSPWIKGPSLEIPSYRRQIELSLQKLLFQAINTWPEEKIVLLLDSIEKKTDIAGSTIVASAHISMISFIGNADTPGTKRAFLLLDALTNLPEYATNGLGNIPLTQIQDIACDWREDKFEILLNWVKQQRRSLLHFNSAARLIAKEGVLTSRKILSLISQFIDTASSEEMTPRILEAVDSTCTEQNKGLLLEQAIALKGFFERVKSYHWPIFHVFKVLPEEAYSLFARYLLQNANLLERTIKTYTRESIHELPQYLLLSFVSNFSEARELIYRGFERKLEGVLEDETALRKFLQEFFKHPCLVFISVESPLFQRCVEINSALDTESGTHNPFTIFKRLKEDWDKPYEGEIPFKRWENKSIRLNPSEIKKLFPYEVKIKIRDLLPESAPNTLKLLWDALISKFSRLDDKKKREIQSSLEEPLKTLYDDFCLDPFIQDLLSPKDKEQVASTTQAKFYLILRFILDQPDSISPGSTLSTREDVLLKVVSSIRNCKLGKEEGITSVFNTLPAEYQLLDIPRGDTQEIERIKCYLHDHVQKFLSDPISGHTSLMKQLTRTHSQREVPQHSHQSLYVRNLVGNIIGLNHTPRFDLSTKVLVEALLSTDRNVIAKAFFDYLKPSELIIQLEQDINKKLKNYYVAERDSDFMGKLPYATLFNDLSALLEKNTSPELDWEKIWEEDRDGDFLITLEGVYQLLIESGILETESAFLS